MNSCSDYKGIVEDFKFTISKKKTYYISGEQLTMDIPIDGYRCLFGFYNSGDSMYHLGDVFLRDFYTVYDLDNYRIGFGKAREFEALGAVEPEDNEKHGVSKELVANLMLLFGLVIVIALVAVWAYKKKEKREPLRHRFPLTDEASNSRGSSAEVLDTEPGSTHDALRFIERTEEEKADDSDEDSSNNDPNETVQRHEAGQATLMQTMLELNDYK